MTQTELHHNADPPGWQLEGQDATRSVVLSGSWQLFVADVDRKRLQNELGKLDNPRGLTWDLTRITGLDSAGAWALWQMWGKQFPNALECSEAHRQRFNQLAEAPRATRQSGWPSPIGILDHIGAELFGVARHILGMAALLVGVVVDIAIWTVQWRLIPWREITAEIYRTGVSSIVLLGVVGYLIGVVMSLQVGVTLSGFGANQEIISLMGLAVLRELGPMIAAIIQVGRSGSAITAGIAGMYLTEELDALKTFGNSPRMRLVSSRVVALVITMPLLVTWTDAAELLGGATTGQLDLDVPMAMFMARLPDSVDIYNFWLGLGKGALFGLIIALVSSHFGLTARASTASLSAQTTRSVVVGLALVLIVDALSGAVLAKIGLI